MRSIATRQLHLGLPFRNPLFMKAPLQFIPVDVLGTLPPLSVKSDKSYKYFSRRLDARTESFSEPLIAYINENIVGDFISPFTSFLNWTHKFLNDKVPWMTHCWLDIRATLFSESFDVPRWHLDGNFFSRADGGQWKFVTVFLGPGTLFIKDGESGRKEIYKRHKVHVEQWEKKKFESEEEEDHFWLGLSCGFFCRLGSDTTTKGRCSFLQSWRC